MGFTETVKQTTLDVMNLYQPVSLSLSTGRDRDVFSLVSFDNQFEAANYDGNSRLRGTFNIDFLISPKAGTKSPSSDYDSLVKHFESTYPIAFKNAGITVLTLGYGNSTVVTDKTTGSTSLVFSLNIEALERK
ncbi:TPA: hypothetical protein ACJ2XA_004270 [Kluyvera georgiana]